MVDVRRRGFLFGAVAALVLPAQKTFFLMPPIIERGQSVTWDDAWRAWRVIRTVEYNGDLYDAGILTADAGKEEVIRRVAAMDMKRVVYQVNHRSA